MIKLSILKVRPDRVERLRSWFAELTRRREEVLETFRREGTRHEIVRLLETGDGPVLIYAMEAADLERAAEAFRTSPLPIDREHRDVLRACLAESAATEELFACEEEGATGR